MPITVARTSYPMAGTSFSVTSQSTSGLAMIATTATTNSTSVSMGGGGIIESSVSATGWVGNTTTVMTIAFLIANSNGSPPNWIQDGAADYFAAACRLLSVSL